VKSTFMIQMGCKSLEF